jgi:tripartite-type tricarboxylate transporter receptor subunit TctC
MRSQLLTAAIIGALSSIVPGSAQAQGRDSDFFRGKTIIYIVATEAGGGYDTYGRLLTRYMQRYLPGARILVKNVPGAGNIIGANTIYAARPDGLIFGIFNTGLLYSQMVQLEGVRFDLRKMSWIGKMADDGRMLVLSTRSGFTSVQDLINAKQPIRLATSGIGGASHIETRILQETLHLNVRLVPNILGGETQLSMLRGEVAGVLETASSNYDFVKHGKGRYVLAIAGADNADVPQARSLVTNPEGLRLLGLVENVAHLGRMTAGPPGIPAARLNLLRQAYMKAVADPDLLAQAALQNVPIRASRGDDVALRVASVLDQPPSVVALLKHAATGK